MSFVAFVSESAATRQLTRDHEVAAIILLFTFINDVNDILQSLWLIDKQFTPKARERPL